MTEQEWLKSDDPAVMLRLLNPSNARIWKIGLPDPTPSPRKLRLFACACCRSVWGLLTDARSRMAVEVAERFVDGLATGEELERSHHEAYYLDPMPGTEGSPERYAAYMVANLGTDPLHLFRTNYRHWPEHAGIPPAAQAALLREIVGNPFHQVAFNHNWLNWSHGIIPGYAGFIYAEKRFGELPILADTMEDAGCDDQAILRHLRCPGPHARGCWVLDMLLGK